LRTRSLVGLEDDLRLASFAHGRPEGATVIAKAGERARCGLPRLTIDVSEDDLRAIAKRGYEGAVTTGHDR
jgi:hypothetical protein